jgi:3-oxoacyl-[acyl-carrier protein] reductase
MSPSRCVVLGDGPIGRAAASSLGASGATVALVAHGPGAAAASPAEGLGGGVDLQDADASAGAVTAAAAALGGLDVLVWAHLAPSLLAAEPLVDLDLERWRRLVPTTVRATAAAFVTARRAMADGGGRIIAVVPTISRFGGAGLVPLSAVLEAQRLFAMSMARRWGGDGVVVNCVAPRIEAAVPDFLEIDSTARSLGGAALVPAAASAEAVGEAIASLCAPAWTRLSGATLNVDGGVWMA